MYSRSFEIRGFLWNTQPRISGVDSYYVIGSNNLGG
ncbi:hypothetical protein T03_11669 [Trichinella britovi]|uniref:Uncharacterized protein n=1 Tax=Trichinella britovi TaxID=45882 RepID=A0A0V0YZV0_TRIBR|nr:hypothetical protein T03_11669 [Trichinella britovi]